MKKFTALFFLCVITFFMFMAPVSLAVKQIEKHRQPEETHESKIDWEKLYPFDDPKPTAKEDKSEKETLYSYIKRKCEEYTSKYILGYQEIVEAARKYEDITGWNVVSINGYNGVVKLYDGFLTTFQAQQDVTQQAQAIIDFSKYCADSGIKFLYLNLPTKICVYEDRNISGKLDFSNQNTDEFLSMLQEAGIKYYDFRKMLHEDGMNHHEAFYRTDHHWRAETGLWASRHILRILHDDYGWKTNPEILNTDNFNYVNYPEWFLGSEGKKVTLSRTKPDDFTMIYPKFSSDIHFEIPDISVDARGDFTITYDMEKVNVKDYYNLSPYGAYNHGRRPVIRIENYKAGNNKKLLLVYDSFSDAVIPFVALDVKYVEAVDLRSFTGSLKNYISQSRPDAIAVVYYSAMPGSRDDYNKPLYVFR